MQAQDCSAKSAFSAAAFADQPQGLTAANGKIDAVHGLHQHTGAAGNKPPQAAAAVEVFYQIDGSNEINHLRRPSRRAEHSGVACQGPLPASELPLGMLAGDACIGQEICTAPANR